MPLRHYDITLTPLRHDKMPLLRHYAIERAAAIAAAAAMLR